MNGTNGTPVPCPVWVQLWAERTREPENGTNPAGFFTLHPDKESIPDFLAREEASSDIMLENVFHAPDMDVAPYEALVTLERYEEVVASGCGLRIENERPPARS